MYDLASHLAASKAGAQPPIEIFSVHSKFLHSFGIVIMSPCLTYTYKSLGIYLRLSITPFDELLSNSIHLSLLYFLLLIGLPGRAGRQLLDAASSPAAGRVFSSGRARPRAVFPARLAGMRAGQEGTRDIIDKK